MLRNLRHTLIALLLPAACLHAAGEDASGTAKGSANASPLLKAMGEARRSLWAEIDSGRCPEALAVEPALREEFPAEPFFLLWPYEAGMVDHLCGNWPGLLDPARYRPGHRKAYAGRFGPDDDEVGDSLVARLAATSREVEMRIRSAVRNEEHRDFLLLHLGSFVRRSEGRDPKAYLPVNLASNRWLEAYPDSPYRDFVRYEIREEYAASPYGFGASLFTGFFRPQGGFADAVERSIPFGFAVEFLFHRAWLRGALSVDFAADLKRDLAADTATWKRGDNFSVALPELQFGFEAYRRPKFGWEPFLSLALVQFENNDVVDSLVNSWSFGAGLQANYWFAEPYLPQLAYLGIALGHRFHHLEERFPGLHGDEWYLEVHLGGRVRKRVRKYD